ncbi:MAG: arginine--tRNA ligase [Pseudohongiellaceae bacterium]
MKQYSIRRKLELAFGRAIEKATGLAGEPAGVMYASRPEFGEYQVNGVMSLARRLGAKPRDLAQRILDRLEPQPEIERLEIAGPGFINIQLADDFLAGKASSLLGSIEALIPRTDTAETIVVDYSSPNLAKEMHVGHLRGTIIGDCLVRVLERIGHHIIRQNHVGDWGTQFGMLIAYMETLRAETSTQLPTELADLEVFYRAAKDRFDRDPEFAERARASVVKLQSGDLEYIRIWKQFIEESLKHCEAVYQKLNIRLTRDDLKPESFYNEQLAGIAIRLEEQGLLTLSQGAKVVFLPEFTGKDGKPFPLMVQKSDGGYLYATSDLAAVEYRSRQLQADRVLYVVDARQSLHFQQLFTLARLAGLVDDDCNLVHVAYGTMMGKDGRPFKTRSGDTVKLIELLDEGIRRAFELVSSKNPQLDEATCRDIARTVGIGSVKYADLSKNRTSDYVFDWDAMLSFEGNTAPYLLYAYTRIKSILKKQSDSDFSSSRILITEKSEHALIVKILQLPEVLEQVAEDYYPSHLCSYLYDLAVLFMRFYEACPILKAETGTRESRLALAAITAATLKEGLGLLGLDTLERM